MKQKIHCVVLNIENEAQIKAIKSALIKQGADEAVLNKSMIIRHCINETFKKIKENKQ